MMHVAASIVLVATVTVLLAGPAQAQSLLERINRGDTIVSIKQEDSDMAAAIKHARDVAAIS
jgi:hypothetical protein